MVKAPPATPAAPTAPAPADMPKFLDTGPETSGGKGLFGQNVVDSQKGEQQPLFHEPKQAENSQARIGESRLAGKSVSPKFTVTDVTPAGYGPQESAPASPTEAAAPAKGKEPGPEESPETTAKLAKERQKIEESQTGDPQQDFVKSLKEKIASGKKYNVGNTEISDPKYVEYRQGQPMFKGKRGWYPISDYHQERLAVAAGLKKSKPEEVHEEILRRRKQGLALQGNTYELRNEIKSSGGLWDEKARQWIMPDKKSFDEFQGKLSGGSGRSGSGGSKVASGQESQPEGSFTIREGSGYGGQSRQPGEIIRNPRFGREENQPEWLKVLSSKSRYFRADDEMAMSMGVGDDSGYLYTHTVRPATDEEAKPAIEAKAKRENRKNAAKQIESTFDDVFKRGESPEGSSIPEGEEVYIGKKESRLYGGGQWFVIGPQYIWAVRNNGADGDDWSSNNVRTGGAGAIGKRIPFDQSVADQIKKSAKESQGESEDFSASSSTQLSFTPDSELQILAAESDRWRRSIGVFGKV